MVNHPARALFSSAVIAALAASVFAGGFDAQSIMNASSNLPLGERIAFIAESFVGTPYDIDPLGEYVTKKTIVADERVDCMYLTFRSIELAVANTPDEAVEKALAYRFRTRGKLSSEGEVLNYEDRFEYAEDMLGSGLYGRDITDSLAPTARMEGSRGIKEVVFVPKDNIPSALAGLNSGDIIFFVKHAEKRAVGEIVGHLGIIKREGEGVFLIHASGRKNKSGSVVKVPFADYAKEMPFAGIMAGRP